MKDVMIVLEHKPGQLSLMGETLGKMGINIEGGGGFVVNETGHMHFLLDKAEKAKEGLEKVGIKVGQIREIITVKLRQEIPGQLGSITRALAKEGINIEVMYSDHNNQLILGVDDIEKGKQIVRQWEEQQK